MRNKLLALAAMSATCLSLSATKNMCVELKNGQIIRYDVEKVGQVFYENIGGDPVVNPIPEDTAAVGAFATGLEFKLVSGTTVSVSGVKANHPAEITIPYKVKIDGDVFTVVGIEGKAFAGSDVTSVTIPSSVKSIDNYAFYNCSALTSVTIPSSVTSIGEGAFYECSKLKNVTVPSSVTKIGTDAFDSCKNLDLVIYNSRDIVELGKDPFTGTKSVVFKGDDPSWVQVSNTPLKFKTLTSSTVSVIKDDAYSKLDSVNIPAKVIIEGLAYDVVSIADYAFSGCENLSDVQIPSTVTSIEYAFSGCEKLNAVIDNTRKNVKISDNAFVGCKSVRFTKDAAITDSTVVDVLTYSSLLFRINSDSLSAAVTSYNYNREDSIVTIPSKVLVNGDVYLVTRIDMHVFSDNGLLQSVTIPSTITEIGEMAFAYSPVTNFNVDPDNQYFSSEGGVLYNKDKTALICVGGGVEGELIIPSSVEVIKEFAIMNCYYLTKIVIPSSVKVIEGNPYGGGWWNVDVVIDNSRSNIAIYPGETFYGTRSITFTGSPLLFGLNSDSTGAVVMNDMINMQVEGRLDSDTLIIPSEVEINGKVYPVTSIGYVAFGGSYGLTSVEIPSSVTSIGYGAFQNCYNLTSVEIPSSVTSIGSYAFGWCENAEITIDNSEENIKFYNSSDKETTMAGSDAFYGVKSVTWLK